MNSHLLALYVVAVFLAMIAPGPDMLFVLADRSESEDAVNEDEDLIGAPGRIGVSEVHQLRFEDLMETLGVGPDDLVSGVAGVG